MNNYTESVRLDFLKELESKEITEPEFWEYYNQTLADYSEVQQAEYYIGSNKWPTINLSGS